MCLSLRATMPIRMPCLLSTGSLKILKFYKHVAPLGLRVVGYPCFYKHVAPLGLLSLMDDEGLCCVYAEDNLNLTTRQHSELNQKIATLQSFNLICCAAKVSHLH